MRNYIALLLVIFGAGILLGVAYLNSRFSKQTRTFSNYTLLTSSWEKYKTMFLNKDGRVIDYSAGSVTTSEGQSYLLLRAVWVDDKKTFDLGWKWTKENMKRKGDNLFGWRWGKRADNKFGFMENGGDNSASDADSDIALALLLAGRRWGDGRYTEAAKNIIKDIWKIETDTAAGKRYLTAGNWASGSDRIIINPSYFAPYAWRLFAEADKQNDWRSLIAPACDLLGESGKEAFDSGKSAGLPPDWLALRRDSGKLETAQLAGMTTNYSFDALRIPWRVAVDYIWNREPRALSYLSTLKFLDERYSANAKLAGAYTHSGESLQQGSENPVMYATVLGYFIITDKTKADSIYRDKIIRLYSNDTNSFLNSIPYYEQNWLWFGAALYSNFVSKF